jgi:hypothetical protein
MLGINAAYTRLNNPVELAMKKKLNELNETLTQQ